MSFATLFAYKAHEAFCNSMPRFLAHPSIPHAASLLSHISAMESCGLQAPPGIKAHTLAYVKAHTAPESNTAAGIRQKIHVAMVALLAGVVSGTELHGVANNVLLLMQTLVDELGELPREMHMARDCAADILRSPTPT